MNIMLKSIPVVLISFMLAGCPLEGDDGATGATGPSATLDSVELEAAVSAIPGINCWDLNADGIANFEEDRDHSGTVDVNDCHVDEGSVRQNPDALYDQEKMCKVLHALSLGSATGDAAAVEVAMNDLGCHSLPVAEQSKILTKIVFDDFVNNTYPDLFAIQRATVGRPGYDYVIKQAYINRIFTRPLTEVAVLRSECKEACSLDKECIAAAHVELRSLGASSSSPNHCYNFHHSDQLDTNWVHICGYSIEGDLASCREVHKGKIIWGKVL